MKQTGELQLVGVSKRFGEVVAVDAVDLTIPGGSYCCLLGPSGCGKTTLLRIIAGHEMPSAGDVLIDGKSVIGMPARSRPTAMMFQSYALFPHLNCLDNVSFSLRMRGMPKAQRRERAQQILDFVDADATDGITLLFESFGFKHGTPLDADYVFDIRCLPNPYWEPELRRYTGMDKVVIEFMENYQEVHEMFEAIKSFLERWLPSFIRENRSYMTIAIGCTGGQHRSVYLAKRLAEYFSQSGMKTQIRHRELT